MKRRDFLKAAPAAMLPFLVGGFSIKAFANNPFLNAVTQGMPSDKVLVLIQLIGGNDGLQTIVPLDQYSEIIAARKNIALDESTLLKLSDKNGQPLPNGLHPNMTKMQNLFSDGKVAIIQNVGYPQPNFSHFRSIDIWLTGSDYDQVLTTGWMGRYLDQENASFSLANPNVPIAIQIGAAVSLGLQGASGSQGMAFSDPTAFNNIIDGTIAGAPNSRYGTELTFIRTIGQQLQKFAVPVQTAAAKGKTLSTQWPTSGNPLADQLKIVAQLIAGGLNTKIYVVNLGGFDSHTDQRTGQDPLLLQLSDAVGAFQDELKLNALEDRVIGMTFSEFGRRIKSNDSGGTDHGAASCMFVFGTKVIPGIHGANPVLPANATVDDNLAMQYDFRQIYASVLSEWFASSDAEIKTTLATLNFTNGFTTIPIIQQQSGVKSSAPLSAIQLEQNYPNPCAGLTTIPFRTMGGRATIDLFDSRGGKIFTIFDDTVAAGDQSIPFNAANLPSGNYFYRLETGGAVLTKPMIVVK